MAEPMDGEVERGRSTTVVIWSVVALVGLVIGGWLIVGQKDEESPADRMAEAAEVDRVLDEIYPGEVVMEVTGANTESADLTIGVGGQTSQQAGLKVPVQNRSGERGLRYTVGRGQFLYLSAQRNEDGPGTIRCAIKVDGKTIAENISRGPYVIATCSGRSPG